ncbi:MAG: diguanylate cyclase [Eubacteriales bacterium]|nr:diguanylate cyclase [Eubacteriales bacterium]
MHELNSFPKTVLIVDDSPINRAVLENILQPDYPILQAQDGLEAISQVEQHENEIAIILLDIIMPKLDGFGVLDHLKNAGVLENIPVVIISSETSAQFIKRGYTRGAIDYIQRPFDPEIVQQCVINTIMLYSKQKALRAMVDEQVREMERNNTLMIDILSNVMEIRSHESGMHITHIRALTELMMRTVSERLTEYEIQLQDIKTVADASVFHDIGKIGIPEAILNKPGKLTAQEFETIKEHTALGEQMLHRLIFGENEPLVCCARDICRWHHERWDGKGYPDGLKGDEIPISAQVAAIADVYDALTCKRVYKPAYSHEQAVQMILDGECGQFNPRLMECFKDIAVDLPAHFEALVQEHSRYVSNDDQPSHGDQMVAISQKELYRLEQEKTKYRFIASLSNEVLFEYNRSSDVLTLSESAFPQFGLATVIARISQNQSLFSSENWEVVQKIKDTAQQTIPEEPTAQLNVRILCPGGQMRWYEVTLRSMWSADPKSILTGIIGRFMNVDHQMAERDTLLDQAQRDSLTGLYHRGAAQARIDHIIEKKPSCGALLVIDIDNFKSINDQYGHSAGDEIIKRLVAIIIENTRKEDVAARVGGDEFVVFLANVTSEQNVTLYLQRLLGSIAQRKTGHGFTVSIGAALCPRDGDRYAQLFIKADQAMYGSKRAGKNQGGVYDGGNRMLASSQSNCDDLHSGNTCAAH